MKEALEIIQSLFNKYPRMRKNMKEPLLKVVEIIAGELPDKAPPVEAEGQGVEAIEPPSDAGA